MSRIGSRRFIIIVAAVCTAIMALAPPIQAQTRHHLSLGFGYTRLLSSDLKDSTLGVDFTNAGNGGLAYRYSITPMVDLTIDSDATVSMDTVLGVDLTLRNSYFGPGVRWYPTAASPRPFLQGNVFLVEEKAEAERGGAKISNSKSGGGFGLAGGVDLKASRLISIPLTVQYLYGKPADDVSGLGFNVAIAFNFGGNI